VNASVLKTNGEDVNVVQKGRTKEPTRGRPAIAEANFNEQGLTKVCKNRDHTDQTPSRSMPIHEVRRCMVKFLVGAA
jgi:hypothetical protein